MVSPIHPTKSFPPTKCVINLVPVGELLPAACNKLTTVDLISITNALVARARPVYVIETLVNTKYLLRAANVACVIVCTCRILTFAVVACKRPDGEQGGDNDRELKELGVHE